MVNITRDFKADLMAELKYFSHCKKKAKDPNHFCTQRELQKNLKMSLRDVGKNLKEMVDEKLLTHEKLVYNHSLRDKFTPIDKRQFESKHLIKEVNLTIEYHLKLIRKQAILMIDRPAYKNINVLPVLHDTSDIKKIISKTNLQGKIDKKGLEYLIRFCDLSNKAMQYVDGLTYATFDNTINQNDSQLINNIRLKVVNEITDLIAYIFRKYPKLTKHAVYDNMMFRMPTYFTLTQLQRKAKTLR